MNKKQIKEKIESLIDHYTPYRPITDSQHAKEIRDILNELLSDIDTLEVKKWNYNLYIVKNVRKSI